jgi:hypothetical protein
VAAALMLVTFASGISARSWLGMRVPQGDILEEVNGVVSLLSADLLD